VTHPNFSLPHGDLQRYSPDFVILEFGTNDIVNGADPLNIATTIIDIANNLINQYGVHQVFVCSILYRSHKLHGMDPLHFKSQAIKVNSYLRNMCADERYLAFHNHRGFWEAPIHVWSRDGVHPNTTQGRKKYLGSIRQAIFLAAGRLANMAAP
jgi:lysophospholipase L1-like esterase